MSHTFNLPLPANLDAEKFVLGAIMTDESGFLRAAATLTADDFSLEKHKRIFLRMNDLYDQGTPIDRVTLANELMRQGQLQSVDGLSYLVTLDEGLPHIENLEGYCGIVKDKAILRRVMLLGIDAATRASTDKESAHDILGATEEALLKLADCQPRQTVYSGERIVAEYPGGVNAFMEPGARAGGIETGFVKFDDLTGGLRPGELFILAARPAMGKSALSLNIAHNVALHKKTPRPVLIFSMEMSKESLLHRMICSKAGVDSNRFRAGYVNTEERRALQDALFAINAAPIFFDDTAGQNIIDIHNKARRIQSDAGLGLVIVDYLQLMQGRGRFENRVQEISSLSRGFKIMAKELRVPFLVLSQLSRAPETRVSNHRPMLSDLRESGSIEQDADLVAFIFREEVYHPDKEHLRGIAELILSKQREGPTGTIKLAWLGRHTKFENLCQDLEPQGNPYE